MTSIAPGSRSRALVAALIAGVALAGLAIFFAPVGGLAAIALAVLGLVTVVPASRARTWPRRIASGTFGLIVLFALVALGLRLRYGGGNYYPDVTGAPVLASQALQAVVISDEPIGNIAVSQDGRVFYTIHPESRPAGARLLEWKDGKGVPWPSVEEQTHLGQVLGLATDARGQLWAVEHGGHGVAPPRVFAFDLATGRRTHEHAFIGAELGSFYQDLEVSHDGGTVYIADASFWRRNPGIVVYDVASGRTSVRLRDHWSLYPQNWIIRTSTKEMVFFAGLVSLQTGIDGIVLSSDDQWLYYAAMSHDGLFRVPTADLRDPTKSDADIAPGIQRINGPKPLSDGLGIDSLGNVLVTDVEHGAVVRMPASGSPVTLIKSERIRWADAVTFGPDGWLYIADSAIPDQMLQSKDHMRARKPYFVWKIQADIPGVAGR